MAAAAAERYGAGFEGLVIEPADPGAVLESIPGFRHIGSSHPVPDERSVAAASAALQLAAGLAPDDLLLVLLSGGGSALMSLPAAGLSLEKKQSLTRQLLASGATIHEINCVRKKLSRIKGGRLALACRARVVTLAISDVPGNDPRLIASGPTVWDRNTSDDARDILTRHGIRLTAAIDRVLHGAAAESPGHFDPTAQNTYQIVASGMTALQAAGDCCRRNGVEPLILGDDLQGEARELAREQARMALDLARKGNTCCLLSGGETTVTPGVSPGRGGRNTEYALALALALGGRPGIWALAADTDGIDGCEGHSGALVDPDTLQRAARAGLEAENYLRRHDTAGFFEQIGGLLVEGPTGTNVSDFRAILGNP